MSWVSGNSLEPERVKEETGLPILVDGAQSAGVIPVDAGAFDYYAISCQKWLCGPDVTGALVVAKPDELPVALPSYFAQSEHKPDGTYVVRDGAERFDSGWLGTPSLAGLTAALDAAPDWRFERGAEIAAAARALLAERYDVVTKPSQAGIVSFRPEGDPVETVERLREQDVIVRELPGRNLIRVSCGYWTSEEDLARLVAALSLAARAQAELAGDRAHRLDHEADVVVQLDAELLGALVHLVAVNAGRERRLLELLLHRLRLERLRSRPAARARTRG